MPNRAGQQPGPATRAIGFCAIVAATLGGAALLATRIDPIAVLFWAAAINGTGAVLIIIARKRESTAQVSTIFSDQATPWRGPCGRPR